MPKHDGPGNFNNFESSTERRKPLSNTTLNFLKLSMQLTTEAIKILCFRNFALYLHQIRVLQLHQLRVKQSQ